LRKITLIPVAAGPTDDEKAFLHNVWKIRQSSTPMPIPSSNASSALLGAELNGIPACKVHVALERIRALSVAECRSSCERHFEAGAGTLAQRIAASAAPLQSTLADASFVKQALSKQEGDCLICYTDPVDAISFCGHGFCWSCTEMARRAESKTGFVLCPCCRTMLSPYDWLHVDWKGACEPAEPATSKIKAMCAELDSIFGKRRPKRRSPSCVWVFAPAGTRAEIELQLRSRYCLKPNPDASVSDDAVRSNRPQVCVMEFDQLARQQFDALEDVIFASPPESSDYYRLVKKCAGRKSPLQVHLLLAKGVESIDDALNCFNPSVA
jgi:hypothetical protein